MIGTSLSLSGVPHEIVGVMPADFETRVLDMRFEFWTLFTPGEVGYEPGGVGPVTVIGRLRDRITIDTARTELASIWREVESRYPLNFNQFVLNLSFLQADNTRTVRMTLLTVSAAVASLVLIAAMNVGTLLLGRGLGRMRETAIRAAIGSGRARLVRQFLTEGLLIVLAGGTAGLVLAAGAVRLFVAWNPLGTLPANPIRLDLRCSPPRESPWRSPPSCVASCRPGGFQPPTRTTRCAPEASVVPRPFRHGAPRRRCWPRRWPRVSWCSSQQRC